MHRAAFARAEGRRTVGSAKEIDVRAVVFEEGRCEVRDDVAEPRGGGEECRVEVRLAGICATDHALRRGYMGFRGVPGHEFVGVALDGPLAGKRVVGEINAGCGQCASCREEDPRHCASRTVLGIVGRAGAFAERLTLPAQNLLAVPDEIPDERAVFAEPLAAALEISAQLGSLEGRRVLVAGDGRLALLCAWVLDDAGAQVEVAGRHAERAALLPASVEHHTNWLEERAHPVDRRFDLAVEATGSPATLARLLRFVRPRGSVVLKTTTERAEPLDLAPFVVDEIALLGSRCGRFEPALEFLARRPDLPLDRFVHSRFALAEVEAALRTSASKEAVKVLLHP